MSRLSIASLIIVSLICFPCPAAEEDARPLALMGATILDGTGAPAVLNGNVVLDGERIACVGSGGACDVPANARVIDLTGKWVTPGLVDSHVHFSQTGWLDGRPDGVNATELFPYDTVAAAQRDNPERFFQSYLCSGVTAVYDVGGHEWTLQLGNRVEEDFSSPHVRASGALVTHAPHEILNVEGFTTFLPMGTVAEGRQSVATLDELGSTAVKVWYVKPSDDQQETVDSVFLAVAEEARTRDLDLIVHATTLREAKIAVDAGAKVLVHAVLDEPVDEEFLRAAIDKDVIYTPTMVVSANWWRALASVALGTPNTVSDPNNCIDPETVRKIAETSKLAPYLPEYMSEEQAEKFLNYIPEFEASLKREIHRAYEAGITIATGTDAGNPLTLHGVSIVDEMIMMQQAGIPASEVLVMSTLNGARAMGRDNDIGTVEPGKISDLLVLDADPSEDVANFRRISYVVRGGKVHPIDELSFAPACGASDDPVDVVQAQVEAYNEHDLDKFLACYADDAAIYDLTGERPVIQGQSALREAYAFLLSMPEGAGVDIVDRIVSDSIIIDKERFVGLPEGMVVPDAIAVYEVRGGKIQRVWFPPAKTN